jgi:hypothetical protein
MVIDVLLLLLNESVVEFSKYTWYAFHVEPITIIIIESRTFYHGVKDRQTSLHYIRIPSNVITSRL